MHVSIIVSLYNEEAVLNHFWEALHTVISPIKNIEPTVVFVNDGSTDKSQAIVQQIIDTNNTNIAIKAIAFSKNFGHEAAMIAGIDQSDDDIIICMDSDMQHPPELLPQMIEKYQAGNEIVLMNRKKRHDNGIIKNLFSKIFYKIIDNLSVYKFEKNASDFFLISKPVANVLKTSFRERNRFLRGYIQVLGFNITTIDFESPARFAGKTNYNFKNLFKLGFTAIFAFSNKPLKISLFFSFMFFVFSLIVIVYSLIVYFWGNRPPSGYTTLIVFQSVGFTVLSFIMSILSIYFGRSLDEIRDRPIYILKSKIESR